MVQPLLPNIPTGPGILGQRFGQFFGAQTLFSNLTVTNGAGINIIPANGNTPGLVPSNIGQPTVQTFVQVGSLVAATNASGDLAVTFPVAFPTGYDSVVVSNGDANISVLLVFSLFSVSATGFSVNTRVSTTGAVFASTTIRLNWIAFGH